MKKKPLHIEKFKIAILEDSPFYNLLLKKQFDDYFENLGVITNCIFSIKTFTNTRNFIESLSVNTDVVLLDFYLEDGETALNVISKIKAKSRNCSVIIISSAKNIHSYYKNFWHGAIDFISKDVTAPVRTCKAVEAIYTNIRSK